MLQGESREQFDKLHATGMALKDANKHDQALAVFERADQLAIDNNDEPKRLDALQPAARALWSMGQFDDAIDKLNTASEIAANLDLTDEQGIIVSNLGRLATNKIVSNTPVQEQAAALKTQAMPKFAEAYHILMDHPHLYYRYANAQHGSVVSALANERRTAVLLVVDGIRVAYRKSEAPYDQRPTYELNRRGLIQFAAATALIPLGSRTPLLAKWSRHRLIR